MEIIPRAFTKKTGWPGQLECALLTSITTPKEWSIKMKSICDPGLDEVFVSSSVDWQSFLVENEVQAGALLVFEVADARCLAVTICHPDRPRSRPLPRHIPRRNYEDRQHFTKTLKATHVRTGQSARLVSCAPSISFHFLLSE